MPIRFRQLRQFSIGATSDVFSVNLTSELDSAETVAAGTIAGFIAGSSTGITFGAVAPTTGTYTEADTGATVAAGKALKFGASATTGVGCGTRVIEITFSTSARGPITRELAFEMV